ncbi:hypothetical protein LSAT2_004501 [Lamellibrachia satsuma]|nr:hypothetical protein LSAT2_004501 [Lamellibrachia satsuma]
MASIEEDEDLIALRSAVLASMKVKPNEKDAIEEDAELLALRQAALQSKKQQHIEEQDGPKHTEQLAIGKPPRLAAPPKQFHSAPQGWGNLIVIPLQEERGPSQGQRPPQTSTHKPILLLPQDKWARGGASGATGTENAVASTKEKKGTLSTTYAGYDM